MSRSVNSVKRDQAMRRSTQPCIPPGSLNRVPTVWQLRSANCYIRVTYLLTYLSAGQVAVLTSDHDNRLSTVSLWDVDEASVN